MTPEQELIARLEACVEAADKLRAAQKAYMRNRGDENYGKQVGARASEYDELRRVLY